MLSKNYNYFKWPCGTQDIHKTEVFLLFLGHLYVVLRNKAINQKMHQVHTILFLSQEVFKRRSSDSAHIINRKVRWTIPFKVTTRYSHSHFQVQWRPKNQRLVISLSLSAGVTVALPDQLALQERQAYYLVRTFVSIISI